MDAKTGLPPGEVERYSRQLLLPQVGVAGQRRLRASSALVVGVGGLGCPAALYLAGAGVGALGLVDRPGDVVEASNLHRQIAHAAARVGESKTASAAAAVRALNPLVELREHAAFAPADAVRLAAAYDVVLDCTDNVAARYLVSDACAAARTPLVSGSAIGLDGQLTVYCLTRETPCYRCIFPSPPPPACVGSCDSAGVLGPVPGTIGTLQALEAVKILAQMTGVQTLASRLLLFDGAEMVFRTVKLRGRSAHCDACADTPSLDVATFDYDAFAAGTLACNGEERAAKPAELPHGWRISAPAFKRMRDCGESMPYTLIDVRPPEQFAMCSMSEAMNIPLRRLRDDADLKGVASGYLNNQRPVVVVCRRGNQSQDAVRLLRGAGIDNVSDIIGGLRAWHHEVDSDFPLY